MSGSANAILNNTFASSFSSSSNSASAQPQTNVVPKDVNVQVSLRCRPMNDMEREANERNAVLCGNKEVSLIAPSTSSKPGRTTTLSSSALPTSTSASSRRTYTFDHVFGPNSSQEEVYNLVAAPIVEEVLQGYNCTVFAYGQTGTGKTHTMEGQKDFVNQPMRDRRLSDHAGIIPRAISHIFSYLRQRHEEYTVRVSHLELYNEQLTDLLSVDDNADNLRIFDDASKGTFVHGLEEMPVRNEEEIFAVLDKSAQKRRTAETLMNKFSSRSHSVFTVTIHIRESTPEGEDLLKIGKLNLVDLAGSEDVRRSGAQNQRAREAGNINQSLLTLGRVITALVEKHPHVPYRDSKLTRLLQESLGGKNKTSIIATIGPSASSMEETNSTLEYAHRAKSIKNRPQINQMMTKRALIKEYLDEIAQLKRELDATRMKNGIFIHPEDFEKMVAASQSQGSRINEMSETMEAKEKELQQCKMEMMRLEDRINSTLNKLTKAQSDLDNTVQKLQETENMLEQTCIERDQAEFMIRKYTKTEEHLTKEANILKEQLSVALMELDDLHDKVDHARELDVHNRSNADRMQQVSQHELDQASTQLEQYSNQLHTLMTNWESMTTAYGIENSKALNSLRLGLVRAMEQVDASSQAIMNDSQAMEGDQRAGLEVMIQNQSNISTLMQQELAKLAVDLDQHNSTMQQQRSEMLESYQVLAAQLEAKREDMVNEFSALQHAIQKQEREFSLLFQGSDKEIKQELSQAKQAMSTMAADHSAQWNELKTCMITSVDQLVTQMMTKAMRGMMEHQVAMESSLDSCQSQVLSVADGWKQTQEVMNKLVDDKTVAVRSHAAAQSETETQMINLVHRQMTEEASKDTAYVRETLVQTHVDNMSSILRGNQENMESQSDRMRKQLGSSHQAVVKSLGGMRDGLKSEHAGLGVVLDSSVASSHDQVSQTQSCVHESLSMFATYQTCTAAFSKSLSQTIGDFTAKQLCKMESRGTTPGRKKWIYPLVLSKTACRQALLSEFEMERDDGCVQSGDRVHGIIPRAQHHVLDDITGKMVNMLPIPELPGSEPISKTPIPAATTLATNTTTTTTTTTTPAVCAAAVDVENEKENVASGVGMASATEVDELCGMANTAPAISQSGIRKPVVRSSSRRTAGAAKAQAQTQQV